MAKKTGKKKSGKKKAVKKAGGVSMTKVRNELNAVLDKMKGVRSPTATELRDTINQFKADIDCGQTLFIGF
jgi:hypothetical protein